MANDKEHPMSNLNLSISESLQAVVAADFGNILSTEPITSGNINQAFRLKTSRNLSVILKHNDGTQPRMFECEAAGLKALAEAGMRTPEVLGYGADFLLLEDLGTSNQVPDWEQLGRMIAQLHAHHSAKFGFH